MKIKRVFAVLLICAGLAFSIRAAMPIEARVTSLCDRDYFPAVRTELRNAKESIVVTMYLFRVYPHSSPTSPTFILIRELLEAHKRGVKVRVILVSLAEGEIRGIMP